MWRAIYKLVVQDRHNLISEPLTTSAKVNRYLNT